MDIVSALCCTIASNWFRLTFVGEWYFLTYLCHDAGDGRHAEHPMVEDLLLAEQGVRAVLCRSHRYHSVGRRALKCSINVG